MDDVAAALSDSLSRSGQGGMLAPFKVADGSLIAPGLGFTNEPTSGLYRETTSTWWAVAAGVGVLRFTPTQVTVPVGVTLRVDGALSAANPLTFSSLTLTGDLVVNGTTSFNNHANVNSGATFSLLTPTNAHAWHVKADNANKLSFSYDLGTPALELNPDNSARFYAGISVSGQSSFTNGIWAASGTVLGWGAVGSFTDYIVGDTAAHTLVLRAGSTNVASISATGLAVTGGVTSTTLFESTSSGQNYKAASGTTGTMYGRMLNTTGGITWGIEGSVSGGLIVGDTAYDGVLAGRTALAFSGNNGVGMQLRISATGLAVVGELGIVSGLGAPLTVDGAGANGVTFLLKQSGVNAFLFGSDKYWNSGNLNDLLVGASGNVIVQTGGGKRATFSTIGLSLTGDIVQTGPAGNVKHTITALTTGFAYVDVANGFGTARLGMNTVGEGVVGTISNLPLVFLIGNAEKMRLTSAGLDITGTLRVSNPNAAWQFGISGTTKGIRFYTSPSESIIEGVDNTLVGSYQPLRILGSILYFSAQGGAYASIGATGLTVFGTLSGLQSVATDYTALTLGQSSNVTAHAKLDFTTGSTNVIGRISSYYNQSLGTGALHFWTYAAATLTNSMTLDETGLAVMGQLTLGRQGSAGTVFFKRAADGVAPATLAIGGVSGSDIVWNNTVGMYSWLVNSVEKLALSTNGNLNVRAGNLGIAQPGGTAALVAISQGGVVQWNLVNLATTGEFSIDQSGVASRLQINQSGSIRFNAYAGAGDRVLHVDANGWITAV